MDLICLGDCGPSYRTIALLLLAGGIAAVAAYRVRWTAALTAPLLCVAMLLFARKAYSHRPAGWLVASVLGILLLGLIAGRRRNSRSSMGQKRIALVYATSDAFVIVANHRTQAGFWLAGHPVARLPVSATDGELGAATRVALRGSRDGIPTPNRAEFSPYLRELAAAAGMRSWAALEQAARLCNVEQSAGEHRIVPHRHGGTRGPDAGFHALESTAIEMTGSDDTALGAAVRRGIELSSGTVISPVT